MGFLFEKLAFKNFSWVVKKLITNVWHPDHFLNSLQLGSKIIYSQISIQIENSYKNYLSYNIDDNKYVLDVSNRFLLGSKPFHLQ